jgi:hypothetical protein
MTKPDIDTGRKSPLLEARARAYANLILPHADTKEELAGEVIAVLERDGYALGPVTRREVTDVVTELWRAKRVPEATPKNVRAERARRIAAGEPHGDDALAVVFAVSESTIRRRRTG